MEPGNEAWIVGQLEAAGGRLPLGALTLALASQLREGADAAQAERLLVERVAASPALTRLTDGTLALVRERVQGGYFRLTPSTEELASGRLRIADSELAVAVPRGFSGELTWRPMTAETLQRGHLEPSPEGWAWPGLGAWFAESGFEAGDDLVVHVRDATGPLWVLDRVSRFDRNEDLVGRRNARLVDAAAAVLDAEPLAGAESAGWVSLDALLRLLVGRFDFRGRVPPDSFGRRLLAHDARFLRSPDGRRVRRAHFHTVDASHRFLQRLDAPEEALDAFLEEYPPAQPDDRDKALAYLEDLWQEAPRAELGGLSPRDHALQSAKIIPFRRPERGGA